MSQQIHQRTSTLHAELQCLDTILSTEFEPLKEALRKQDWYYIIQLHLAAKEHVQKQKLGVYQPLPIPLINNNQPQNPSSTAVVPVTIAIRAETCNIKRTGFHSAQKPVPVVDSRPQPGPESYSCHQPRRNNNHSKVES